MKKKVTKSFAFDEITIAAIQEIKEYLNLKNDSEAASYAIVHLALCKNSKGIKLCIEQEIARRRYVDSIHNTQNAARKLK